jgi:hypothetical protein
VDQTLAWVLCLLTTGVVNYFAVKLSFWCSVPSKYIKIKIVIKQGYDKISEFEIESERVENNKLEVVDEKLEIEVVEKIEIVVE